MNLILLGQARGHIRLHIHSPTIMVVSPPPLQSPSAWWMRLSAAVASSRMCAMGKTTKHRWLAENAGWRKTWAMAPSWSRHPDHKRITVSVKNTVCRLILLAPPMAAYINGMNWWRMHPPRPTRDYVPRNGTFQPKPNGNRWSMPSVLPYRPRRTESRGVSWRTPFWIPGSRHWPRESITWTTPGPFRWDQFQGPCTGLPPGMAAIAESPVVSIPLIQVHPATREAVKMPFRWGAWRTNSEFADNLSLHEKTQATFSAATVSFLVTLGSDLSYNSSWLWNGYHFYLNNKMKGLNEDLLIMSGSF